MKKSELIEIISQKTKLSKKTAKDTINTFLLELGRILSRGERVKLAGFGVFWTKVFKAKEVLPIGKDKKKKISSRRMPRFTPGTALKRAVK